MRHTSRLFLAAATLSVPFLCVIVRRAFGLGAQAMAGGSLHAPAITLAWPSGEFGAMGVEGAVRLALRGELAAIEDEAAREQRVKELVAAVRAQSSALNAATYFELDDVIDPAETRARLVQTLRRRRSRRRTRPPAGGARWSTPGERAALRRAALAPSPVARALDRVAERRLPARRARSDRLPLRPRARSRRQRATAVGVVEQRFERRQPLVLARRAARPAPPPSPRTGRPARRATSPRPPRTPSASRSSARG